MIPVSCSSISSSAAYCTMLAGTPDRHVPGALEHVQVQPSVEDAHVHPAVARRDRGARRLALAADLVLRDPRRDEVGAVAWQLPDLLDQVLELVEAGRLAVGNRWNAPP